MWRLEFTEKANKQLSKMDSGPRKIIISWLLKNIAGCENPREYGKGLAGNKSGKWRYRIGVYRVLCEIQDDKLVVLALEVGHRKDIYRK